MPGDQQPMKRALKSVALVLLGRYRFNRVYRLTTIPGEAPVAPEIGFRRLQGAPTDSSVDPEMLPGFDYAGEDSYGWGLLIDGRLAAMCWFWGPRRFRDRRLWELKPNEAILVELRTTADCRGRGLAPLLLRHASAQMRRMGWDRLYTWMWHTHRASYRAFEKAGWGQVAWVLEVRPFGRLQTRCFRWKSRPRSTARRRFSPLTAGARRSASGPPSGA